MKVEQSILSPLSASMTEVRSSKAFNRLNCQLVLAFSDRLALEDKPIYSMLRSRYPKADIVICSAAGQILQAEVFDSQAVITAIEFDSSRVKSVAVAVKPNSGSEAYADSILAALTLEGLQAICIISEGSHVNATTLLRRMEEMTEGVIPIFGGLAGDADRFEKTVVGLNADAREGQIVALGFYGEDLEFGFGCHGGWDDFGPEREVTHSEANVLYKIEGRDALELYKDYLGKYATQLPSAALYFPLSMRTSEDDLPVVRTILSIDESTHSLRFGGDVIQGSKVRLMKANDDNLIDAAFQAARASCSSKTPPPELALLISCVGRKLVLGERTEEELEAAKEVLGDNAFVAGFYSYGEISPNMDDLGCAFHNQTMTITTIRERIASAESKVVS